MKNSVGKCNTKLYRQGPCLSIEDMKSRTVLQYRKGENPTFNARKLLMLANQLKDGQNKSMLRESIYFTTRKEKTELEKIKGDMSQSHTIINNKKNGRFNAKSGVISTLKNRNQILTKEFRSVLKFETGRLLTILSRFYSFGAVITVFWYVSRMLELKKQIDTFGRTFIETLQEAICILFREAQKLHPPACKEMHVDESLRVLVITPRLKYGACMRLFGTCRLIVLGNTDPLRNKIIRWKHEVKCASGFDGHRSQKGTLAEILSGPIGVYWVGMKADVRKYCRECAVCVAQKPYRIKCEMGPTLLRDVTQNYGFSDVSIDPLAGVLVHFGRKHHVVYPLLIQCITTKAIFIALMPDMKTSSVFRGLAECSYRYNGAIRRIYCDGGSNLLQKNLFGNETEIVVRNNLGHSQFRNVSESSTRGVKKLLRELSGKEPRGLFELKHIFEVIASVHNNTPFIVENNFSLYAPMDAVMPSVGIKKSMINEFTDCEGAMRDVQRLARLGELYAAKVREESVEDFITQKKLWSPKDFPGRDSLDVSVGDICVIVYNNEICVVKEVGPQLVKVQLRGVSGTIDVHKKNMGILVSRRMSQDKHLPEMCRNKNAFLSVDIGSEGKELIGNLMEKFKLDLEGNIKYRKLDTLHITLGLLSIRDEAQAREMMQRINCGMQELGGTSLVKGFLLGTKGVEIWKDEKANKNYLIIHLDKGHPTVHVIRAMLEERLGEEIEEKDFTPHITMADNVEASAKNQSAVNSLNICNARTRVPTFMAKTVTLRFLKARSEAEKIEQNGLKSAEWLLKLFPTMNDKTGVLHSWEL